MKCPHCLVNFHDNWSTATLVKDMDVSWDAAWQRCPSCRRAIISLYNPGLGVAGLGVTRKNERLVYPSTVARAPLSPDVPADVAQDYKEACAVLADSPKASAALSRRCLQHLLRDKAGVKHQDLSKEIQEVLDSRQLPPYLANDLDVVRHVGNLAAHPIHSQHTGEIVDVEPGEAEWLLNVLEGLFEFYYVQEAEAKRKRDDLNKKLQEAGKPPIKQPQP